MGNFDLKFNKTGGKKTLTSLFSSKKSKNSDSLFTRLNTTKNKLVEKEAILRQKYYERKVNKQEKAKKDLPSWAKYGMEKDKEDNK